ncbi:pilus assembly protein TadG-related protein [Edaphosphingomonas haloaromaticamans]|uniref:DUF2134 domain-containing protein n=1 Tax=Edaphosphingomonas haloaromaticamans TaxID=653954 RepID=A0A1S1HGB1_9SPHN|nr:pilus assembly protein TadG-related protein [Sphingomonas haloaromaticamans]OHT20496.1 hypothetical protein BHE75_02494 [Sphingomonas haloaromaticamans]
MRPFPSPLAALRRDAGGGVTILAAASMMACLGCLALAVDLGSIYFESRRLQGVADAAAIAAVADVVHADAAVRATVQANRLPEPVTQKVELGSWRADPAVPLAQRFTPSPSDRSAARVTLGTDARLYFGIVSLGRRHTPIQRKAIAARSNLASFSIGSRLAGLQGGIANALLSALAGSQVNLSVMDYNALAQADVDLLAFSDALRASLDLTAASYDQTLSADLTTGQALEAIAHALQDQGSTDAAAAVRKLLSTVAAAKPAALDKLIDLGPIGAQDHAVPGQYVKVNTFDMTRALLELANGNRQVALDLGASIPGITKTTVKLAIGDRPADSPWLAVTAKGEPVIRTAQTRVYIEVEVLPAGSLLGIANVRLPLFIELAAAEAKLSAIDCSNRRAGGATLLVRPSIGHAAIANLYPADISNHKQPLVEGPAPLVSVPLVTVTGQARVDLTAPVWKTVSFSPAEISARTVKSVSSDSLVQGLVLSLISGLNLNVNIIGLGIGTGPVGQLIGNTLAPVAPALDGLLNALTDLLGLHLGQADVRVNGVRCGAPALVA